MIHNDIPADVSKSCSYGCPSPKHVRGIYTDMIEMY